MNLHEKDRLERAEELVFNGMCSEAQVLALIDIAQSLRMLRKVLERQE